jgi:hypothetical protein
MQHQSIPDHLIIKTVPYDCYLGDTVFQEHQFILEHTIIYDLHTDWYLGDSLTQYQSIPDHLI